MTHYSDLRNYYKQRYSLDDDTRAISPVIESSRERQLTFLKKILNIGRDVNPSLNLIIKPVDDICNLRCSYCVTRQDGRLSEMKEENLNSILDNLISNTFEAIKITWHGGEPTLAGKDYYKFAFNSARSFGVERGVITKQSIQTNATLIDEDWCDLFKEYDIQVGVSLDGPQSINDTNRINAAGKGSFDSVIKGLQLLKSYEIDTGIISVVPDQSDSWDDYFTFISEQDYACITSLEILFRPHGIKNYEEYALFFSKLFEAYTCENNSKFFKPTLFTSIIDKFLWDGGELCWINGTCNRHLGISKDGRMTPCCDRLTGSSNWSVGSVLDSSLVDLLNNKNMEEFWIQDRKRDIKCHSCQWQSVCNSGCTFHRIRANGSPASLDPYCSFYEIFFYECYNSLLKIVKN